MYSSLQRRGLTRKDPNSSLWAGSLGPRSISISSWQFACQRDEMLMVTNTLDLPQSIFSVRRSPISQGFPLGIPQTPAEDTRCSVAVVVFSRHSFMVPEHRKLQWLLPWLLHSWLQHHSEAAAESCPHPSLTLGGFLCSCRQK